MFICKTTTVMPSDKFIYLNPIILMVILITTITATGTTTTTTTTTNNNNNWINLMTELVLSI